MIKTVGIENKPFYIKVSDLCFKKGDIITNGNNINIKVLKIYKNTWWRRLLLKFNFKVRILEIKVKTI